MKRRVVISGIGVVSPIGCSAEAVWESLEAGRSGVQPLQSMPTATLPVKSGGEVAAFRGKIDDFGVLEPAVKKTIRKGLKVMCREIQMGVAAAQMAMHHSQLDRDSVDPRRIGAVYGSDYIMTQPEEFSAGVEACLDDAHEFDFGKWAETGMPRVTPLWLLKYLPNMPACHVAIYNDLRGPNNSITVREASSNLAIAEAVSTITRGAADWIVAGATGSRIHPLRTVHTVLQEELATGDAEPATLSRPFDLNRHGMVVGEGAAALVLEELQSALDRDAKIYGEIIGYGASTVIRRDGVPCRDQAMANAMNSALASAGQTPATIGHVHAHGLGTQLGDVAEATAIGQVIGDAAVPVVAAKSYFGNLGAASGMVELVSSLMSLQHERLFPTLNYSTPDPECPLNVVVGHDRASGPSVLSVNVTPQGQASAVVVQAYAG